MITLDQNSFTDVPDTAKKLDLNTKIALADEGNISIVHAFCD